eukprot:g8830.t1
MAFRNICSVRLAALACFAFLSTVPVARAAGRDVGVGGATCGFVAPTTSRFHSQRRQSGGVRVSRRSVTVSAAMMTVSEGVSEGADAKPYSDLPADWRAPLPPREFKPKKGAVDEDGEGQQEGEGGKANDISQGQEDGLRTPAEVLQQATRVTPSSTAGGRRLAQAPPGVESFQTENQRRRTLPLSQLKRAKPKKRVTKEEEKGEFRPLVLKTDRESVLRGEDYWIDYSEVDKRKAQKEARAKAPAPDQFAQSKMKAEIVNPYKQNWILVISIAIVAIAGFVRINPGILDDPSIITDQHRGSAVASAVSVSASSTTEPSWARGTGGETEFFPLLRQSTTAAATATATAATMMDQEIVSCEAYGGYNADRTDLEFEAAADSRSTDGSGVCTLPPRAAAADDDGTQALVPLPRTLRPLGVLEDEAGTKLAAAGVFKNKMIGVYVSAGWCPPCRAFSLVLSRWAKERKEEFEVVFVSLDKSEQEMKEYVAGKGFVRLTFEPESARHKAAQAFGVQALPTLIIVNGDSGNIVTTWGRSAIMKNPQGCLEEWKAGRHGVTWLQLLKPW